LAWARPSCVSNERKSALDRPCWIVAKQPRAASEALHGSRESEYTDNEWTVS